MQEETYEARARLHDAERAVLDNRARRVSWARLVSFALVALGAYKLATAARPWWLDASEVIASAGFIALIAWHGVLRRRARFVEARARACEAGACRARRDWNAMPAAEWTSALPATQQATELHVVGPHSLIRLLPAMTPVAGRPTIWQWLVALEPPPLPTLLARQEAIRELMPQFDWRERLSVFASRVRGRAASLDGFKEWAAGRDSASNSSRTTDAHIASITRRWFARTLSATTIVVIVAATSGRLPAAVALALMALNLALAHRAKQRLSIVLAHIATDDRRIGGLADVFAEATSRNFVSPALVALRERMEGRASAAALRQLERIVSFGDLRFSPMAHVIAQAVALWDVHVLDALHAWRARHGQRVESWLAAVGEVEAFAALATLAYDNPHWSFPDFHEDPDAGLAWEALAHPLLSETERVANDVSTGAAGSVLLVTGPNMAGKSTLLRAVGLNVVLAQLGAPVCAFRCRMRRVRLRTSIHAVDALESGVSLFMAELLRVKTIVEDSRAVSDAPVLYVVDEMLRGTNTEERHLAVSAVLEHLMAAKSIGVVSTHDVELSREPRLAGHVTNVHFSAQFTETDAGGTHVSFDYRLQPGPATGRNAMRLLEMMGLSVRSAGERDRPPERNWTEKPSPPA